MYKQVVMADAWIREAEEALKLVEDIENRVKDKKPSFIDIAARSKLLESGIKVDRLESLLRNPPSKPILTDEDVDYRWKMLSDMRIRTKALALCLYALPTSSRPGSLTHGNDNGTKKTVSDCVQDRTKTFPSEEERDLFRPLIANDVWMPSQVQTKQCTTSASPSLLKKVFWIFGAILGLAALTFLLIVICAVI
ncbi:hypothetical protein V6N13_052218 [Hibiscus sabdariffa]|uniref:Uncharacterized protein n=1 Tax=Hibiscus sabdariffa TaxID=183260 RepID=A0ABR2BI78_9ROSI